MRYDEASQIVTGLVLKNKIPHSLVRPEQFMPAYDKIIEGVKEGKTPHDLMQEIGIDPVVSAMNSVDRMNGLGNENWLKILNESKVLYESGTELEKLARKMSNGSTVEITRIRDTLNRIKTQNSTTKPLSQIEDEEMPFIPTGWAGWDKHIGGLPEVGMVIIAGNPGSGKTTFMGKLAGKFSAAHPDKKVVVYSAEMIEQEIAARLRGINKLTKEQEDRILINDMSFSPEKVLNDAALIEDVGLVLVDFADYLIDGEITDSAMGKLYRTFAVGAKELHCPIIVLAQLNRSYRGGVPRLYHIRYSSMAEILGWMIVMLHNPNTSYFEEDDDDPILPLGWRHDKQGREWDLAYALFWKCRGGFKKHPNDSPGAIQFLFNGSMGWHDRAVKWFPLNKR